MNQYPLLFSPMTLGKLTLKNRIVSAPTSLAEIGPNNTFSPENIAYYELRAKGGAALVNCGECVVHGPTGMDHPRQVILNTDDALPSLYDLVQTIHKYGAYASIELGHGGKRAHYLAPGTLPIGPSDLFDEAGKQVCRGMDRGMMDTIVKAYADSAKNVALAGFDMLTVHCGHGWLLAEFLSPLSNFRTDEYGGTLENRCRFVIEVLQAVRKAAPRLVLEIRISGDELTEKGYHLDEGVEICKLLEPYVDCYNVSAGVMEDLFTWIVMHPSMFLDHGCNVYLAEAVKKAVGKPVSCVGGIADPAQMEEILASGKADYVALGRALVADPDLPNKVLAGREDLVRHCLRCYTCQGQMGKTRNIICCVNPVIGQEYQTKFTLPAAQTKRVAVIGGGPAGLQAAITAKQRGHDVTIYEKKNCLGGALTFAAHESFKHDLYRFAQWQMNMVRELNIPVAYDQQITASFLDCLDVDVVLCAVGANPITPDQFGIPGDNYILGTRIFDEGVTLGRKIVIMGGGLVGCETALHLAETGHEVTVIEMTDDVAMEAVISHRRAMKVRMAKAPVPPVLQTSTKCRKITEQGVVALTPEGEEKLFEADTVICALGLRPQSDVVEALRKTRHMFMPIGDCTKAQQVTQAVRAGYDAAMGL